MPKVQISKERILEAALGIVIAEGHESVNIKTVAAKLGCSTQPISWTFGNMENFRTALAEYAHEYVNEKMYSGSSDVFEEYGRVGAVYIDLAFDAPNLIHFLRSDEKRFQERGGFAHSLDEQVKKRREHSLAEQLHCTPEQAEVYIRDMRIFTQGIVSSILSGVLCVTREEAYAMLAETSRRYLISFEEEKS